MNGACGTNGKKKLVSYSHRIATTAHMNNFSPNASHIFTWNKEKIRNGHHTGDIYVAETIVERGTIIAGRLWLHENGAHIFIRNTGSRIDADMSFFSCFFSQLIQSSAEILKKNESPAGGNGKTKIMNYGNRLPTCRVFCCLYR